MITKLFVIFLFLIILGSLASAMFYMMRDTGNSKRMVRALTMRISLSVVAFVIVMVLMYFSGGNPKPY